MTKMILTLGVVACLFHPRPAVAAGPATPGPHIAIFHMYEPDSEDKFDPLRTDISSYIEVPDEDVTELMDRVPLRGVGHQPDGPGPFPLVLVVHGNDPDPTEDSHLGYGYLTKLLASHGMIAISIDENFLNGSPTDEIDARAIVLLRHLQLWRKWNDSVLHPFFHKVDLSRIGLIGHSRGGEAITVANLFDQTLHHGRDADFDFNFGIDALFAIAPTDGRIQTYDDHYPGLSVVVNDADYFIMHGSHDGDIFAFEGQKTYDRAFPQDLTSGGSKGLLFVQGANHRFWNDIWDHDDKADDGFGFIPKLERPESSEQKDIAKVYVSGFFQWSLLGKAAYQALLTGEARPGSLPEGVTLVHQFSHRKRLDLDNYEEDQNSATGSFPGVTNTGSQFAVFSDQDITGEWDKDTCTLSNDLFLWHETRALVLRWASSAATYTINLPAGIGSLANTYPYLSLRIGQIYGNLFVPPLQPMGRPLDLSIQLQLGTTTSPALQVSSFGGPLRYPVETTFPFFDCGSADVTKSMMRTVRIPLRSFVADLREGALDHLSGIQIRFDQTSDGMVVIDDIQLSQ